MQGEGFEPPKAEPDDLQSPVFDRFTIPAWMYVEPPVGLEPTRSNEDGLQNRCSRRCAKEAYKHYRSLHVWFLLPQKLHTNDQFIC